MGIYNTPKIVNEVYFGKTEGILEIQNQFSKFRSKYINNKIQFSTKINIDEDLIKFNRLIEKEFGFGTFSLYIINDIYHQAYTVPIGLTPGKSMSASSKGFKLNKKNKYSTMVCISTGLLFNKNMSDKEVFAILLHEIGHNFSQNIDKHTSIFFAIQLAVSIAHMIETAILFIISPITILNNLTKNILSLSYLEQLFINFGNYFRKKNKNNATKIFDFLIGSVNSINTILREKSSISAVYFMIITNIKGSYDLITDALFSNIKNLTPLAAISTILGYNGERVSDNFTTVYGYGSELSSALSKMEFSNNGSLTFKFTEKVPLLNNFYKAMTLPAEIIFTGFDCHPNTPSRINQQLVFLNKEIQKEDLDPKMKESIYNDIKNIQKVLEDNMFTPYQNKIIENIKDPYLISRLYCSMVYKICGGDLRDLAYTIDNNKQFDDAYKKYKKE